jgi:hypothetical protein
MIKTKVKWSLAVLTATAIISGTIWYSNMTLAAVQNQNPIGAENVSYVLNPEPILKSNLEKKQQLLSTKDKILNKFKLKPTEKVLSTELKKWSEFNTTKGGNSKHSELADDRIVWEVTIDSPEGVDTRGGFYNNAKVTYVIDAETEKLIEMFVKGELDPTTSPLYNQNGEIIHQNK